MNPRQTELEAIEGLPPGALVGRRCLVTGATNGHGRAVADALAALGAELVLLGRDGERTEAVADELRGRYGCAPELLLCDLASREAIDHACATFLADARPLHVLVNNAGAVFRQREQTVDGHEATFGVNYLAMFQLTLRLLPRLCASARPAGETGSNNRGVRIVNVSSDAHRVVSLDLDDLQTERRRYTLMGAYGRSKLAILYFTRELARRLRSRGVSVNACDPGPVDSRIGQNNPGLLADLLRLVMRMTFPSADRAAKMAVQLCAAPELAAANGAYYRFGKPRRPRLAEDHQRIGAELWQRSLTLCQLDEPTSLANGANFVQAVPST
jgi:retinol dehydrogenase-12